MKINILVEHVKIYLWGLTISTSFVLIVNDMFYNLAFGKKGSERSKWHDLRPREIFGVNAKTTFIKHKIVEEEFDGQRLYHEYIQNRKWQLNNDITDNLNDLKLENINNNFERKNL